jgi:CDP-diacylglycerol--glycerol-3-phosphate 3-phosphatidyltransferase
LISIYQLKSGFQALLRPTCNALVRVGVTANQVTLVAVVLSLVTGGLILSFNQARWPLLLVPVVLFVRMALNAIDGMIAREHDMKTPLGAILNELGDVVSDTAVYLPLTVVPGFDARLVVGVVVLSIISEMTGVIGVQIGASRRYDGPMGKSDRAFVFGALCLAVGIGAPAGPWVSAILGLMVLLLLLTVLNRCRGALKELHA